MFSNRKAGKDCLTLADVDDKPLLVSVPNCSANAAPHVLLLSLEGNGLAYPLSEVRELAKGSGVILIAGGIADVACACAINEKVTLGKYSVTADKLLGKRAGKGLALGRKRKASV